MKLRSEKMSTIEMVWIVNELKRIIERKCYFNAQSPKRPNNVAKNWLKRTSNFIVRHLIGGKMFIDLLSPQMQLIQKRASDKFEAAICRCYICLLLKKKQTERKRSAKMQFMERLNFITECRKSKRYFKLMGVHFKRNDVLFFIWNEMKIKQERLSPTSSSRWRCLI